MSKHMDFSSSIKKHICTNKRRISWPLKLIKIPRKEVGEKNTQVSINYNNKKTKPNTPNTSQTEVVPTEAMTHTNIPLHSTPTNNEY